MELLIVIAVAAIVLGVGSQLVLVSIRSNKNVGENDASVQLRQEVYEAVISVATAKWQNVFNLLHDGTVYHPTISSGSWILTSGTENVTIDGIVYTRSFTVQHVCRVASAPRSITGITDTSGSATTCAGSGGTFDPSTEQVSTTVSWPNGTTLTGADYITRWRNKVCNQTTWSSTGSGPATCPSTLYDTKTNITTGSNLQLCLGGC